MTSEPVNLTPYRQGQLPTPLGRAEHGTRTVALNGWLAREEAVAVGAAAPADPALLGLPGRESLVRALFQRFATTLEGALDHELETGGDRAPYAAVRAAFGRTVAHRPADWRALRREAGDPLVAVLTRRQHARIAGRAGLSASEVGRVADEVARTVTLAPSALAPRARRRRAPRILARRAG